MRPTSQMKVNLAALKGNVTAWKRFLGPSCRLCGVVKADGYGLGLLPMAQALVGQGVRILAVYCLEEARQIAASGLDATILVLMPVEELPDQADLAKALRWGRLHLALHSPAQMERLECVAQRMGCPIPVHLEVDTGMSRLGACVEWAGRLLRALKGHPRLKLAGVFSHPAMADEDAAFTEEQLKIFESLLADCPDAIGPDVEIHFAATHAALRGVRYHKSMVRIGLGLYGYGLGQVKDCPSVPSPPAIKAVFSWTSRIVHVMDVPGNTSVGYRRLYHTPGPKRLGIVSGGYADGYPLSLTNRGLVRVGKQLQEAPIRGQVNMDQIIVDITGLNEVGVGSEVELISADPSAPNGLERLASLAGSNCYEMLCRMSDRVPKTYLE